ncbi:hypothetical protein HPB47_009654 [Ixodes persulcatus]|uniref:Uncharacterized protein n=1 Tax=Ixodes persulcatus TaxID=34615 RepID=A0AC60P1J0_IXOPE|nr:hypothetical protein HPB47_009654 [Ixodes persulcatus]
MALRAGAGAETAVAPTDPLGASAVSAPAGPSAERIRSGLGAERIGSGRGAKNDIHAFAFTTHKKCLASGLFEEPPRTESIRYVAAADEERWERRSRVTGSGREHEGDVVQEPTVDVCAVRESGTALSKLACLGCAGGSWSRGTPGRCVAGLGPPACRQLLRSASGTWFFRARARGPTAVLSVRCRHRDALQVPACFAGAVGTPEEIRWRYHLLASSRGGALV